MKITAKRRFGQHFLRDTGILDRLVRLIDPRPDQELLEIGAGEGVLSLRLAPAVSRLRLVELDNECIPELESSLRQFSNVEIVHGDILDLGMNRLVPSDLRPPHRIRVVGNLPYNIATAIIERFLEIESSVEDMVFTVQLEVAQRITAEPCSKEYGYLSVRCQRVADVQLHFKISPECFAPRPKVISAVISLRPKRCFRTPGRESAFMDLVKASFAHRRKTLLNSLRCSPIFENTAAGILDRTGVSGARRAEDLTVEEYERISQEVYRGRNPGATVT